MKNLNLMFIGKLAQLVEVNVQTIRYYERIGLLPPPTRTKNGYRVYNEKALNRLRFIKQAQALGFSLAEIKTILALSTTGQCPCPQVRQFAKAKLWEVDQKLKELFTYRQTLAGLIRHWDRTPDKASDEVVCTLIESSDERAEKPKS
ncbi:Transcription regulator MerR DNA binding protein [Nitrosococcus halophilus Nc 4]|uniref:Transcription regulator MerR DNA binding protein n=1 Tax=Nitrosococcus halophilus (strain Nc4) TaxID=472759 RepID=D5C2D1_NITHN|nr:heavy metal-responsive transcriptional regulator [Nitrosococcus halophilus]ADE14790.1 Transcription regulator MerR DNA binding protein [Nitrosococcus halophilus Nc 4]